MKWPQKGREAASVALYGTVRIPRAWCPYCQSMSLVIKGSLACCGAENHEAPQNVRRMSIPPPHKRRLSAKERAEALAAQDGCCFYCDRPFGEDARYKGRRRRLRVEWDHMVPWAYSRDNRPHNFVAACQVCNQIKSDRVFSDVEAARAFIQRVWLQRT